MDKGLDEHRIKQIIERIFITERQNSYYVNGSRIGKLYNLCAFLSKLEGLTSNESDYFKHVSHLSFGHRQRMKISKIVENQINLLKTIPKSSFKDKDPFKEIQKLFADKENKIQTLQNKVEHLETRNKELETEFEITRLAEEKAYYMSQGKFGKPKRKKKERISELNRIQLKCELNRLDEALSHKQFKKPRKKKEVNPGYVYLVKSTIMKEGIAKVGKSSVENVNNRLGSYGKQRTEYRKSFVYNFSRVEDNLIKEFGKKFEKVPDRNEYFIGDIQEMMKVFDLVVLGIN